MTSRLADRSRREAEGGLGDVHPASRPRTASGRVIELKAHRAVWTGAHPPNSLAAAAECLSLRLARAELDLRLLSRGEWVIAHDEPNGRGAALPTLTAFVDLLKTVPGPTVFELDAKDAHPWPWERVHDLAQLLQPVRTRVVVAGCADENLRRLATADPELPLGFNPAHHFDWAPPGKEEPESPPRRSNGYLDAVDASGRTLVDHLRARFTSVLRLVPTARELHLRLAAYERLVDDGLDDLGELTHSAGMILDLWTLNAGTPRWRERLRRAVASGADMISTDTGPLLAAAVASLELDD